MSGTESAGPAGTVFPGDDEVARRIRAALASAAAASEADRRAAGHRPASLPPGFATRRVRASGPRAAGGDWYDVARLRGGRSGIVVGDCAVAGVAATAVMEQLRTACRALLLQDLSPAQVLAAMDGFAALIPGAAGSTTVCAVLDPGTGQLTYGSAGHPPPVVAHPDGRVQTLPGGRSAPLAVRPARHAEASVQLPGRSTLLLYTSGLAGRPGVPLDAGIAEAGALLRAGRGTSVAELATRLMTGLAPLGGYRDDALLIVYRHPGPLDLTFRAEATQLTPVRAALRAWLGQCGLTGRIVQDILVAAGEACANAIEHGHRGSPGEQIRLRAEATVTGLRLRVTDTGRWLVAQSPASPFRGHGIALMRALMNQVTIEPSTAGTTVEMRLQIAP